MFWQGIIYLRPYLDAVQIVLYGVIQIAKLG